MITLDRMDSQVRPLPRWMLAYPPPWAMARMYAVQVEKAAIADAAVPTYVWAMAKTRLTSLQPIGRLFQNISTCLCLLYHLFSEKLLRMSKSFSIGANRNVSVKKQNGELNITIAETDSEFKTVTFPAKRWVHLTSIIAQIDESVNQLMMKQNVDMKLAIGGKWYVSVVTGYPCVDLREWYFHPTLGLRPTKRGIALRICEFNTLKNIIRQIFIKHSVLTTTTPCYLDVGHQIHTCTECNPFLFEEKYFSAI